MCSVIKIVNNVKLLTIKYIKLYYEFLLADIRKKMDATSM